jgi:hypothetical protein
MDNLIKPFDGRGGRWADWLRKFEIVAKGVKWEKDEAKCDHLSLFLEGDALRIFEQLPEASRKDFKQVCKRLNEAFMPSPTEAHQQLIKRGMQEGESVEGLFYGLVDLWKLSLGSGAVVIPNEVAVQAVLPFFLAALPPMVTAQLRMVQVGSDVDELLSRARSLMSIFGEGAVVGALTHRGTPHGGQNKHPKYGRGRDASSKNCYRCGDRSHEAKDCWSPVAVCYWCKRPGHVTDRCNDKQAGKPRMEGKPSGGSNGTPGSKNALAGKSAVSWSDLPGGQ